MSSDETSSDTGEWLVETKVNLKSGRSAKVYTTHIWKHFNWSKSIFVSMYGSLFMFQQGLVSIGIFAYVAPRWLSIPVLGAYALHVCFSRARLTGSMEWKWLRGLDLHILSMEYYNYRILLPDDLKLEDTKYVIGQHPHGIFALGQVAWMFTSLKNPLYLRFPLLRNKVHSTGASIIYYIPFVRELFMVFGHIDVSRSALKRALRKGSSVGIVVGGEAEVLLARNDEDTVVLKGRKGFVKLALQNGADLLPTYCFYNTNVFHINVSLLRGFRKWLQKNFKCSIPVCWGWRGTPLPNPAPLCLAIGDPIKVPKPSPNQEITDKLVDEYHQKYMDALTKLFEECKGVAGYPEDRCLNVVDAHYVHPEDNTAKKNL